MTIREKKQWLTGRLEEGGVEDAGYEAMLLVELVYGMDRTAQLIHSQDPAPEEKNAQLEELLSRRLEGEPIQYLLGQWEFMGLPFLLSQDTLIPRADTETLCQWVLDHTTKKESCRMLDLCCGSGCIGISLAYYLPKAEVELWDISAGAVEMTKKNAALNGVESRCTPKVQDVLKEDLREGCFDYILSNPPYIPTGDLAGLQKEVQREPRRALDGGETGMDFYEVLPGLHKHLLKEGGVLLFECGIHQSQQVAEIMRREGYREIEEINDLHGIPRVVLGRK